MTWCGGRDWLWIRRKIDASPPGFLQNILKEAPHVLIRDLDKNGNGDFARLNFNINLLDTVEELECYSRVSSNWRCWLETSTVTEWWHTFNSLDFKFWWLSTYWITREIERLAFMGRDRGPATHERRCI